MPSITLTFSATEAARLQAALASTSYLPTAAGLKALLTDYLDSWVTEYERAEDRKKALAGLVSPPPLTIT